MSLLLCIYDLRYSFDLTATSRFVRNLKELQRHIPAHNRYAIVRMSNRRTWITQPGKPKRTIKFKRKSAVKKG